MAGFRVSGEAINGKTEAACHPGMNSVFEAQIKTSCDFPHANRLHAAAEFSKVFAARRLLRGQYFDLHYLLTEPQAISVASTVFTVDVASAAGTARLGLVIAKKLARRAVQRNLLKRLAREAFRHAQGALPPCDVVLRLARPPNSSNLRGEARQAWRADIDQLLKRLVELPLSLPRL